MVSFIIPAYNCENYISKCIESILLQDYSSLEIIIINDGSKDSTQGIIEEYAKRDTRIRLFNVENGGPSRARNIGLDNAHGDWVVFVDADDWLEHDFIAKIGIRENNLPDIVFWGFIRHNENGNIKVCSPKNFEIATDKDSVLNQLRYLFDSNEEFFGYSWNKIFRRSIIEKSNLRFEEGLNTREDELFTLNYCCYITSLKTISYAPYNYRILSNSLSHNSDIKFRNYGLLANKECEILPFIQGTCFHEALVARIFNYYLSSISECLFLKRQESSQVINKAISFFDKYCDCLNIPIWQKIILDFPIKSVRGLLLCFCFKIRLIFKSRI